MPDALTTPPTRPRRRRRPDERSADRSHLHAETRAIRAGRADNDTALAPILWATTTFVTPTVDEGRRMATMAGANRFYSRYGNPTVQGFEDAIAELEGAESARAFASGMGAISAVVLGLCSKGDHIVAQRQLYAGTQLLLQTACPRFGIDVTFVDATEPGRVRRGRPSGQDHAGARRDAGQPPARPGRPRRARRHRRAHHGGRLDVRHAAGAAPARPRRRPRRPLGHQGHRRAQRRHPGRGGGQRRADPVAVELRRAAGGQRLAVRRHERPARAAHAGGAAPSSERERPAAGRGPRSAPGRGSRSATRASTRIPSASWPSGRWRCRAVCSPSTWPAASRRAAASWRRTRVAQLATSLGGPETLVTHPASTTHVNLTPDGAGGQRHRAGDHPRLGGPRARRRHRRRLHPGAGPHRWLRGPLLGHPRRFHDPP